MTLSKRLNFSFERFVASTTFVLMFLAACEINQQLKALGVFFSLTTFWWPVVIGCIFISCIGLLFVWSGKFQNLKKRFIDFYDKHWFKNKLLLLVLFTLISLGFSIWVFKFGYIVLNGYLTRLFFFILTSLLGMLCLKPFAPEGNWKIALAGAMLLHATLFKILIYTFQGVSTSPFSLSWSEGSRYYYGSLFFSERIYGIKLPLSPLHPSRYILLAMPFAIPNPPIWIHRSWQVFLWIVLPGLTGFTLAKRMRIKNQLLSIFFISWIFLFLNLGPVYYHLLICVILIYLGVDFQKPGQTMVVLLLASIWAGLSRINWIPVPVFLVLTLYFLERPWNQNGKVWKYWWKPVTWGAGILVALISYAVYIPLSGNQTSKFGSTFTSELLWNRLFPNPTYPYGVLIGTFLVSIPLWLVIYIQYRRRLFKVQFIISLGYSLMLLTLFFGGLIVSVKIGGGSNLHNMDAYFVLLMTITSTLYWRSEQDNTSIEPGINLVRIPKRILAVAVVIPVLLILQEGGVVATPDRMKDQQDLSTLQTIVKDVASAGGEILFISERQLQVFSLVPKVPLIPEYEKLILMEMAMAGNEPYLAQFYKDISSRRFELIVTDSVRADRKDEIDAFSEEHNVWVGKVMVPLLGNYKFQALGGRSNIYILTPR